KKRRPRPYRIPERRRGLQLVGATGFEPATTCTPSKCATRLRYAPALLSRWLGVAPKAPARAGEVSPVPRAVNANASVPEPEREEGISIAPRTISGERCPEPVRRAPERERPEAHVESGGHVQPSRHVVETSRLPVGSPSHPQPARDPLVFGAHANRCRRAPPGPLHLLLEKGVQPVPVRDRASDYQVGRQDGALLVAEIGGDRLVPGRPTPAHGHARAGRPGELDPLGEDVAQAVVGIAAGRVEPSQDPWPEADADAHVLLVGPPKGACLDRPVGGVHEVDSTRG